MISQFVGHSQEVCGLKWAPSGQQLASGGNDNLLHIWDVSVMSSAGMSSTLHPSTPCLHRLDEHQAAVKALAWCPFQSHLLASGGGTADRCIKFWNTQTGSCIDSVDTQSQVSYTGPISNCCIDRIWGGIPRTTPNFLEPNQKSMSRHSCILPLGHGNDGKCQSCGLFVFTEP